MAAKWYIYKDNSTYGPYNWDELCRRGKEGLIAPADMVKSEQMPEWVKASELPGLTLNSPGQESISGQETGTISGSQHESAFFSAGGHYSTPPPFQQGPPLQQDSGWQSPGAPYGHGRNRKPIKTAAIIGGIVIGLVLIALFAFLFLDMIDDGRKVELAITNINTAAAVSADDLPIDPTNAFPADTPEIHVTMEVTGAGPGTPLTAKWIWEEEDHHIDSETIELSEGASRPSFSLVLPGEWPSGSYRIELSTGEGLLATARFNILEPVLSADPIAALENAVLEWWSSTAEGRAGEPIINSADIDQAFYDQKKYEIYSYSYTLEEVGESDALVIFGIIDSEILLQLEFERVADQWVLAQERMMPTPGFDMLDVMGLHKDELLSLFGDPDQYYFQEEHGGEMFYEYLGATFYYTPGSEIVDAITITAIYEDYGYGLMDIYVGSSFDQVESWLGAPDYEGYDELFTEAGMPSYGMHYFLENGYPGLEGQLNLFFFAESADRPISQIYALWFE